MTMGAINEYTTNLKTSECISEFIRKSEFISNCVVFYLLFVRLLINKHPC